MVFRPKWLISFLLPTLLCAEAGAWAADITWKASGRGGAVAAGGSEAVAAGLDILRADGNAADAAVATLLALSVTDYGAFAIGGEIPLIIYDANKQEVKVLSGLGRAPLDPEAIEWFYENGIPSRGDMRATPVPGAVDLCLTTLKLYGTKSFEEVVGPTLALLDAARLDWHPRLAATLRTLVEAERNTPGNRVAKLDAVRRCFYRGEVADELEAWYVDTGAWLRKPDLAAHRTVVEDPVTIEYRGYKIHKCGPWTQGPTLCQTLRLLEGFDLRNMGHLSADYIHALTEALKLGFADRDEYYGDPVFADVPLEALLSDQYTAIRRPLIDMSRASLDRRPGDPRRMRAIRGPQTPAGASTGIPIQDTTTCVVADRLGNVVAATPSCNLLTNRPGPSGITQGNRLRSLNTTPGHPNRIEPGKRPRITLTPTLVTKDGKPVIAISVAGGDLQEQTTLNVLLAHIEFGMSPEAAVTAPRFHTSHYQNSFDPNPDRDAAFVGAGTLRVNTAVSEETRRELSRRGHELTTTSDPIAHPVMIHVDPKTGIFHAAGDPKAGRHAGALDVTSPDHPEAQAPGRDGPE